MQAPRHAWSQPPPSKPASTTPTSAPTRLEPTCFTDIVWQAAKSVPGTCILESRACLSRQSSLEHKASATDKCPASLRTASLRRASLRAASLRAASLRTASLRTASLRTASLRTASLRTASVRTASLRTASLRTASLRTASLRTASHFLCPGNGTLFYGKKRYVRYGAAFVFEKVSIRTPNKGS